MEKSQTIMAEIASQQSQMSKFCVKVQATVLGDTDNLQKSLESSPAITEIRNALYFNSGFIFDYDQGKSTSGIIYL